MRWIKTRKEKLGNSTIRTIDAIEYKIVFTAKRGSGCHGLFRACSESRSIMVSKFPTASSLQGSWRNSVQLRWCPLDKGTTKLRLLQATRNLWGSPSPDFFGPWQSHQVGNLCPRPGWTERCAVSDISWLSKISFATPSNFSRAWRHLCLASFRW